jgi:hypothetical protein
MHIRGLAACAVLAAALGAGVAHADTVKGSFTILNGAPSPSGGTVTFTLNGDGTIAASLTDTSGTNIDGFGFDSVGLNLPESNFSPTAPDNMLNWTDMYGKQNSGFLCKACGVHETWTIGNPGDFTSVKQALGGGNSSHPFFMFDSTLSQQWAADIVPEPATWAMMLAGLGGLGAMMRRRRRATNFV